MRHTMPRGARRGAMLIELMIAMTIMLFIAGGISQLLLRSWLDEEVLNDQNLAQKTAQQAVDVVVDRIRAAQSVASGDATQITVVFENNDTLSYSLVGNALHRSYHVAASGATAAEDVLPDFVTGLSFTYLQRNGAEWEEADVPSTATCVEVSVTAAHGKGRSTESSMVKFRNKT